MVKKSALRIAAMIGTVVFMAIMISLIAFFPRGLDVSQLMPGQEVPQAATSKTAEYFENVGNYLKGLAGGDLGTTTKGEKVFELVKLNLPRSLFLLSAAFIISVFIGVPVGVWLSRRQGRVWNEVKRWLTIVFQSLPDFFFIILLQYIAILLVRAGFDSLPPAGFRKPEQSVLPIIALSFVPTLYLIRITMQAIENNLPEHYIRTAYGKGLSTPQVIVRHAFKNSLVQIIDNVPYLMVIMLSNLLLVEYIFYYPGAVYRMFMTMDAQQMQQQGFSDKLGEPEILASTAIIFSILFITIYLVTRGLRKWIDPRLRG